MENYREYFKKNAVYANDINHESSYECLDEMQFHGLITDIEIRVNDIKDMLEPIKGLTDIDKIKEEIKELSRDLY